MPERILDAVVQAINKTYVASIAAGVVTVVAVGFLKYVVAEVERWFEFS